MNEKQQDRIKRQEMKAKAQLQAIKKELGSEDLSDHVARCLKDVARNKDAKKFLKDDILRIIEKAAPKKRGRSVPTKKIVDLMLEMDLYNKYPIATLNRLVVSTLSGQEELVSESVKADIIKLNENLAKDVPTAEVVKEDTPEVKPEVKPEAKPEAKKEEKQTVSKKNTTKKSSPKNKSTAKK